MAKQFTFKKLFILMSSAGVLGFSQYAAAAAFQLWEQDGASIGNYHAGAAAIAQDASTAWYNPAGMVLIPNQEFVLGSDIVMTDIRYHGTVGVSTINLGRPQFATAQGGGYNFIPDLHYVAPITENTAFGFSIVVPFGLKTNYGDSTPIRYAATLSSIQVIDYSPDVAVALNNKFSVGLGLDIQHLNGEFDQMTTLAGVTNDTLSTNKGSDTAYGYHAGVLFQYSPDTRIGLSYHSQVVHHLNGTSVFSGRLANYPSLNPNGVQQSNQFTSNMTLPPITTLSLFHSINPKWDVMGSVSYIQWSVFQNFILKNVAGLQSPPPSASNNIQVTIHEGFKNTWNYAVGANYHANEKWILRTGLGFDQSPAVDKYRSLQLPDSDRIAVALGAHYQAFKTVGFDAGWTHLFVASTRINNLHQVVGNETVTTNGSVNGGADVYGFQVKWDIT